MRRRRRSRRNPTSAKPANWASMSRQERKAWNKADFAASHGTRSSSTSTETARRTPGKRYSTGSSSRAVAKSSSSKGKWIGASNGYDIYVRADGVYAVGDVGNIKGKVHGPFRSRSAADDYLDKHGGYVPDYAALERERKESERKEAAAHRSFVAAGGFSSSETALIKKYGDDYFEGFEAFEGEPGFSRIERQVSALYEKDPTEFERIAYGNRNPGRRARNRRRRR